MDSAKIMLWVALGGSCLACQESAPTEAQDLSEQQEAIGLGQCPTWQPCPAATVLAQDMVGNPYCAFVGEPGSAPPPDPAPMPAPDPPPPPPPPAPDPPPVPGWVCPPGSFQIFDAAGTTTCVTACPPGTMPVPEATGPKCVTIAAPPPPPPPPPPAPYACPWPSWYSTNSEGLGFCIVSDIDLPVEPQTYCHWLHLGYIGFSWPEATNVGYECPEGLDKRSNLAGLGFCILPIPTLPTAADLTPYCQYLDSGTIGFHWSLAGG